MNYKYDDRDIFIKGKYINLKLLSEEDIENSNWYGWFNSEETTKYMQKHYIPNSEYKQKNFLCKLEEDSSKIQLGIVTVKDSKFIGIVSIQNINNINRTAEISLMIGEKEYRKAHFTEEAMRLMIEHAFETLNLRKIYGGTISEEWAFYLKRMFGFQDEGLFKEHVYKNGEYKDIFRIALFKKSYYIKRGE